MPIATMLLHSEIESPRPLRAAAGHVTIKGWAFFPRHPMPPRIRLVTPRGTLETEDHLERPDVGALFPENKAAPRSGFLIRGSLPAGIHSASFEALNPEGDWQQFSELSLVVAEAEFTAALDTPIREGTLRDRVKVGGWALHPDGPLSEISLHYGHRKLSCTPGLKRSDVPALFPAIPHAHVSGFISDDFLVAGHGPVRIQGKLQNGRTVIVPTPVSFSIDCDENHEPELDLTADRIGLERGRPHIPGAALPSDAPLNILFILHGSFAANSALHIAALANELCAMGHDCAAAVTHDLETISRLKSPAFRPLLHDDALESNPFANGNPPDIIHAWTTREQVRILTNKLYERHSTKVVIHLEDNEQQILCHSLGMTLTELNQLSEEALDQIVPADLSHPIRARDFLKSADGITYITETLEDFVPPGRPSQLILPAADARYFFPRPRPDAFRKIIDPLADTTVIFYHGNVHAANASEVRELYSAIDILNRNGESVTLIRTGIDTVDFLGDLKHQILPHVINLGLIHHHHLLPSLMALADIFVQPGSADAFNDYRFPSKLPEFFSIGRPVVLPRTNLGRLVTHRRDAYVLDQADAQAIAGAIQDLRRNPQLYQALSDGAVNFAQRHFNWRQSAETLANFYGALTRS